MQKSTVAPRRKFRLGFRVSRAFGLELCKYRSHVAEEEIGRRLHTVDRDNAWLKGNW